MKEIDIAKHFLNKFEWREIRKEAIQAFMTLSAAKAAKKQSKKKKKKKKNTAGNKKN